jgi:Fe2+ or Zn2+ uptake regulation protein
VTAPGPSTGRDAIRAARRTSIGTGPAGRTSALLDTLARRGHRITEPRRAVAELVAARGGHFTAAELVADARRSHQAIGRATVFRALDLFASLGLVERVDLPGGDHAYVACEAVHHHHAICTGCGRSLDVDDLGLGDVLAAIGTRSGFRVTTHRLEIFGLCAACQRAGQRG